MDKATIVEMMLTALEKSGKVMIVENTEGFCSRVKKISGRDGAMFFRTEVGALLVSSEVNSVRFEELK